MKTSVVKVLVLLLAASLLSGCHKYISSEASKDFNARAEPFSVLVYPVNVIRPPGTIHPDVQLAEKVATFLEAEGLAKPLLAKEPVLYEFVFSPNQAKIVANSAKAFAAQVSQASPVHIRTDTGGRQRHGQRTDWPRDKPGTAGGSEQVDGERDSFCVCSALIPDDAATAENHVRVGKRRAGGEAEQCRDSRKKHQFDGSNHVTSSPVSLSAFLRGLFTPYGYISASVLLSGAGIGPTGATNLGVQISALVTEDYSSVPNVASVRWSVASSAPTLSCLGFKAPAGRGDEGNMFVIDGTYWAFNLSTRGLAKGAHVLSAVSGGESEYRIDPGCEVKLVIRQRDCLRESLWGGGFHGLSYTSC